VAAHVVARARAALRETSSADTAIVIVDVQHDFCAPDGRFATLGLIDPERTAALVEPLACLLAGARARGLPVVFVRTLADDDRVPANVARRNKKLGRAGYLCAGEAGARFFGVEPRAGERVVTKVGYDAFLGTDLENHLRAVRARHVVVAGVFTELCVDALARSAYQKGFEVSLVVDATLGLERDSSEAAAFMARYYDATLIHAAELAAPS
jgi:nicotinamidase-related amidase